MEPLKTNPAFFLVPDNVDLLMRSLELLNTSHFTISDADITHRWITYWDQEDILLSKQPDGKWRKFSLTEFVWLKTIAKMRLFNVSIPAIRIVRDAIQSDAWPHLWSPEFVESFRSAIEHKANRKLSKKELKDLLSRVRAELPFNCLSILIFSVLTEKVDIRIILAHDGTITFYKEDLKHEVDASFPEVKATMTKTHLSVSLQEIVLEALNVEKVVTHLAAANMLSPQEEEILRVLRMEKVTSVRVFKNPKTKAADMLEYTETKDVPIRVQELILKEGYHRIEIKTKKGGIVFCERTTKKKL